MMMMMAYVVSDSQYVSELRRDAGVITGHERRVSHNAQRHKQIDERVHDEQLDVAREPIPARRTLPVEQQLIDLVQHFLLPRPIILNL